MQIQAHPFCQEDIGRDVPVKTIEATPDRQHPSRRPLKWSLDVVTQLALHRVRWALLLSACCAWTGCGGDVLYGAHALNHPAGVLLRQAEHRPLVVAKDQVAINYLRAGGLLFRWQGESLMTAPFFSNYSLESLIAQRVVPDGLAIRMGLSDPRLELRRVAAILVGHSHYDHIGDLPLVARDYALRSRVLVNQTGAHMLSPYRELTRRVSVLEREQSWISVTQHIRVLAIASEHAPNAKLGGLPVHWAPGQVEEPWQRPWEYHFLREQREGTTFAFLIDFLDPDDPQRTVFRVHYQDAASRPPKGYLPASLFGPARDDRDVDLAVLCMPGRETLPAEPALYPTGILRNTRAHHALVIHYEDFFRPIHHHGQWSTVQLLPTLQGDVATDFLGAIFEAIVDPRPGPCAHPYRVQGLCSKAYTVPLPGEWLTFDAKATEASVPLVTDAEEE
jgi:Beta-lactamase superfamily domain